MSRLAQRFNRLLPVVLDVETGGVNADTDALLEIAIALLNYNDASQLVMTDTHAAHITPFDGANIDPVALEINGIIPDHPFRDAKPEKEALDKIFSPIWTAIKQHQCQRAILVGHNAHFDLAFIRAACERTGMTMPFHRFCVIDTATLGLISLGQHILAQATKAAHISFDSKHAHSALYDTEKTAELFCHIVNKLTLDND